LLHLPSRARWTEWEATVVFRGLAPDEFTAFHEPGYVKIVWTLRADPVGSCESIFRTETRVATTDPTARKRFRWFGNLKKEAERRADEAASVTCS
jgi:hypothetical protein